MSTLRCPHCGDDIELVGQKELTEEYGLGPNPVANLRAQGVFPEPVLEFGNRNMWLRPQLDEFVEKRNLERLAKLIEDFDRTIAALPEADQAQARKMLIEKNGIAAPPRGKH